MRRKIEAFLTLETLKHLCYIPTIILKFRNWLSFLMTYVGIKNDNYFMLRNGIKIKTREGADSQTIAVIFVKKEYGEIKDNSVVIDIGANIGVYSVFAASGSKNTVIYAYEPMVGSYNQLLENININKLENRITPFNLGVAAEKGVRTLNLAETSPFNSMYGLRTEKSVEINCVTLKDIFDENRIAECDILKIDCEGAEFEILYNTPEKVLKKIKEIRLEYHNIDAQGKYNIKSLADFLESNGFKPIKLTNISSPSHIAWFKRADLINH